MVSRGIIVERSLLLDYNSVSLSQDADTNVNEFQRMAKNSPSGRQAVTVQLRKYRVRVPLIHGVSGDASSVPDNQLPFATYCPLPGTQETELSVGDIVYVATVDFKWDDLVIIGCVPTQQISSVSGPSLKRVHYLQLDDAAPFYASDIHIGSGNSEITTANLQSLQGFSNKLTDYVWPLENGGTGVSLKSNDETSKQRFRENFGIWQTKIVTSADFEKIQSDNKFEKNTIYYIYQSDELTDSSTAFVIPQESSQQQGQIDPRAPRKPTRTVDLLN